MDLQREFTAVRSVGTPIVAVKTQNQPATINTLKARAVKTRLPVLQWDAVRGLVPLTNPEGSTMLASALGAAPQEVTLDPVLALDIISKVGDRTLVFLVNAHRFVADPRVSTGIGNLRELFKANGATCVLLGPAFSFPAELVNDVIILDDPLPDDAQLERIVEFVHEQAAANDEPTPGAPAPTITGQVRRDAVAALRGLSGFAAEQQAFLSLRRPTPGQPAALDMESLWDRKIEAINAIPGLFMQYPRGAQPEVRGLTAIRKMLDALFAQSNPERPGACLHIDEIDKALGGAGARGAGDSSGVSQDQVGQLLQFMEDKGWDGIIPVGPPGTGKSLISKTAAGLYAVPYVRLDLGGLKGSLVGESEQRVRAALETIDRIGAGRVFVFATCNRLDSLPPELKRRFTSGIWYFDLPTPEEARDIWKLYLDKYKLSGDRAAGHTKGWALNWTGAEIRNVCRSAWRLNISIEEARHLIVPTAESGREELDKLRSTAIGRFLDASAGGKYAGPSATTAAPGRRLEL